MAHAFGWGHGLAMGSGFGIGLGFLNFLGTILFVLAIVWGVRLLLRGVRGYGPPWRARHAGPRGHDEALEVARERLARGEIGADEYDRLRTGLTASNPGSGGDWAPWHRDEALDVARLRFARGEIDASEFDAVRKALRDA